MKTPKELDNDLFVRIDALMRYANSNVNKVLELRKAVLQNDLIPTKLLIPGCSFYGMKIEFYEGHEIQVVGEKNEI